MCRLHVHHHIPVSDGGDNRPEELEVLCDVCHARVHQEDFENRSDWNRARERALTSAECRARAVRDP